MKKILIDTGINFLAMRGDVSVTDVLLQVDRIGFSVVSVGELFSGFKGGTRERENKKELALFLDSPRVHIHMIDVETAEFYALVLGRL